MSEVYLDNAATTAPYPEAVDAVRRWMTRDFGNASSLHRRGVAAKRMVDEAAQAVADFVGTGPWKVIFTSGGTEANNLALRGVTPKGRRTGLVVTAVDHASVTDTALDLDQRGCTVTQVGAGTGGVVSPGAVAAAVDERCAAVSIAAVAPEMGTVQPVTEVAAAVKRRHPKTVVHVDAVQAAALLPRLNLSSHVDMVTLSAHKLGGPQGVGALLVRPHLFVRPLLSGGDQQEGVRPGTINAAGVAGFAAAVARRAADRAAASARMAHLTERLVAGMAAAGARPLGDPAARAPGMAVFAVPGVRSEVLLHTLERFGLIASAGSACHASRSEPPRCLVDAGLGPDDGALRLSLCPATQEADIEAAIEIFARAYPLARDGKAGR